MRILHVLDHSVPLQSGYSFRTLAILEHQRRRGWETFHLTSPKHYAATGDLERVGGYEFYRSPAAGGLGARLPVVNQALVVRNLAKRLEQVVEEVAPDVLHAHSPALNGVAALAAARRFALPLVYEVRAFWEDAAVDHGTSREGGLRYRLSRGLETYVLRRAHAVTTICEGLEGEIAERGIPKERITVIPNAVDLARFGGEDSKDPRLADALGLGDETVLGFIGSFYDYEGLDTLLAALPPLLARRDDVRVLLVGGGPQEAALRRQAKELGLEDAVVFTGRVPHEDVHRYYALVDVLVYPRRSMRLTELVTPLKPLEAMAHGRIVALSDVGGHRELVTNGELGYVFRAGDVASLAETLERLLAEASRWPRMREAARRFVASERSWPASVSRYEAVYDSVLGRVEGA